MPKGVYKQSSGNFFRAKITTPWGTRVHLGTFMYAEDAEAAYKKAAEKYHGEFAVHTSRAND